MKATHLLALVILSSTPTFAQPQPAPLPPQPPRALRAVGEAAPAPAPEKVLANYLVTVNWSDTKAGTNFLQVLTTPGTFNLNAIQSSVRINNNDVPTTVSFKGTLTEVNADKINVQIFLGRTVPYVTSTYSGGGTGNASSSYQQMQVGLDSRFVVTLGKPVVIQSDQSGEVTLSVKRQEK